MQTTKTIGIVGGGQLGRMLTLAALPLGFKVIVLEAGTESPATQVGASQLSGSLYDHQAINRLAELADYLTIEIEHINADALEALVKAGKQVNPSPRTLRIIQDKFLQKEFLAKAGIPVAPYVAIADEKAARKALKDFGGKMLLKTRHGAYDGRGNMLTTKAADIKEAFNRFGETALYAEAFVPFDKELAVMVARDVRGKTAVYPVVETRQINNICVEVMAPAAITSQQNKAALKIAKKVADHLEGAGVFGIELFLAKDNSVLVNEIAPRVHNSGHYTIEACRTSQFEQHIRAISGLSLGSTEMVVPAAVMINILGQCDGPTNVSGLDKVLGSPHTSVHIYGKSPTKVNRKMGHITATGKTLQQALKQARAARRQLEI